MMTDNRTDEEIKADIREALDIFQHYIGKDGKLNGTKLCQEIKTLKAENERLKAARELLEQSLANIETETISMQLAHDIRAFLDGEAKPE